VTDQPELTEPERAALSHWSSYGRPGEAAAERWVPDESERRRLLPMQRPAGTPLAADFDPVQTALLRRGVGWREMEDKWVVWSDDPDADGRFAVHLNRSWTGFEIVGAELQLDPDGSSRLTRLVWETDPDRVRDMDQPTAWGTFVEVCRWSLGMTASAGSAP